GTHTRRTPSAQKLNSLTYIPLFGMTAMLHAAVEIVMVVLVLVMAVRGIGSNDSGKRASIDKETYGDGCGTGGAAGEDNKLKRCFAVCGRSEAVASRCSG
ncbi:hypothetical protein Vafri_6376, partial [Volvox africanus]